MSKFFWWIMPVAGLDGGEPFTTGRKDIFQWKIHDVK